MRSFLSQFQGQFEAKKNTFFDRAVADISWHFTKDFIKYKLLFLARSNGALLSRSTAYPKNWAGYGCLKSSAFLKYTEVVLEKFEKAALLKNFMSLEILTTLCSSKHIGFACS